MADGLEVTAEQAAAYVAALDEAYRQDRPPADPTVAVVDGEGIAVRVRDGHLQVSDGEGWLRRERTYNRATSGLRRLVVVAGSGMVTLEALHWCEAADVSVVVLDRDEAVLALSPSGKVDARILRLQAAPPEGLAVEAARQVMRAKLTGQARVAQKYLHDDNAVATITAACDGLTGAPSVAAVRQLEAEAAARYWLAWEDHPATTMHFARADASRVPAHWSAFAGRASPLTNGNYNRRAATPTNGCLNYLYKVAAVEARLAIVRIGLHPSLGFLHLDEPRRENLVWDLVETVRPDVDAWLLDLLAHRSFRRGDFLEASDGAVTIAPALCHDLMATMPRWAQAVAPHVERFHHLLGQAVQGKWTATTPLSHTKTRSAAAQVKERKASLASDLARRSSGRSTKPTSPQLFRTCERCGGQLDGGMSKRPLRQRFCSRCYETMPGQAIEHRRRRGQGIAASREELERWRAEHPNAEADPADFEPIRERLAKVTLRQIMEVTGVAKSTASMIRSGRHVPALRHWPLLAELVGMEMPEMPEREAVAQ